MKFEAIEPLLPANGDAVFINAGTRLLPEIASPLLMLDWTTCQDRAVTRAPLNLLCHVRRIIAHCARGDRDETYGALLDLFMVLGPCGQDLRRGLLDAALPLLPLKAARLLRECLEEGLQTTDAHPRSSDSRLTQAMGNGREVVRFYKGSDADDPVAVAEQLVADGECAPAIALLEGHLVRQPRRATLQALLALYRREHMRTGFQRLALLRPGLKTLAPADWTETEAALSYEAEQLRHAS